MTPRRKTTMPNSEVPAGKSDSIEDLFFEVLNSGMFVPASVSVGEYANGRVAIEATFKAPIQQVSFPVDFEI